jgi:amino acid transporter
MFGARRMGASAAVFSVVALIFLVGVSQGVLPGVERTNRNLPANEPNAQRPSGVDQRPPRPGAASVSHREAFALTVAVLALSPSLSG